MMSQGILRCRSAENTFISVTVHLKPIQTWENKMTLKGGEDDVL